MKLAIIVLVPLRCLGRTRPPSHIDMKGRRKQTSVPYHTPPAAGLERRGRAAEPVDQLAPLGDAAAVLEGAVATEGSIQRLATPHADKWPNLPGASMQGHPPGSASGSAEVNDGASEEEGYGAEQKYMDGQEMYKGCAVPVKEEESFRDDAHAVDGSDAGSLTDEQLFGLLRQCNGLVYHDKPRGFRKRSWVQAEDDLLKKLVEVHGAKDWNQISTKLEGRSAKQCCERWHNYLKPDIRKDAWRPEEDQLIMEYHRAFCNKWSKIAEFLPGRTGNSVKNRYYCLLRRDRKKMGASAAAAMSMHGGGIGEPTLTDNGGLPPQHGVLPPHASMPPAVPPPQPPPTLHVPTGLPAGYPQHHSPHPPHPQFWGAWPQQALTAAPHGMYNGVGQAVSAAAGGLGGGAGGLRCNQQGQGGMVAGQQPPHHQAVAGVAPATHHHQVGVLCYCSRGPEAEYTVSAPGQSTVPMYGSAIGSNLPPVPTPPPSTPTAFFSSPAPSHFAPSEPRYMPPPGVAAYAPNGLASIPPGILQHGSHHLFAPPPHPHAGPPTPPHHHHPPQPQHHPPPRQLHRSPAQPVCVIQPPPQLPLPPPPTTHTPCPPSSNSAASQHAPPSAVAPGAGSHVQQPHQQQPPRASQQPAVWPNDHQSGYGVSAVSSSLGMSEPGRQKQQPGLGEVAKMEPSDNTVLYKGPIQEIRVGRREMAQAPEYGDELVSKAVATWAA